MAKAPDLLESAIALFEELNREMAGWEECNTCCPEEKRARVSQMKIVLNSCEAGDLRRAIVRTRKAAKKAA